MYEIVLDPAVSPVKHTPKKVPGFMKSKFNEEFDRLENLQVITPV